jgi:hypothetical protein
MGIHFPSWPGGGWRSSLYQRRPGQAKREPGSITTDVYIVQNWGRNPVHT